jgi:hypothetical protein
VTGGIRVTATDLDRPEDSDSNEIMDNYVIVCAGSCEVTNVNVHHKADGTSTHVITVKGIRR